MPLYLHRRVQCESSSSIQNSPIPSLRPDEGAAPITCVCGGVSWFASRSCCWRYPWRRRQARAQGEASISGSVTDATGSAIPHATIRIINTEKGAVRTILTDGAGRYEAPLLAVGHTRFPPKRPASTRRSSSVSLVLGQHANVDLTLSVAGIHQTVQVEAARSRPM